MFYTKPKYIAPSRATNGYSWYERQCLCSGCGETIGEQHADKVDGQFHFIEREKTKYNYCPYCGCKLED